MRIAKQSFNSDWLACLVLESSVVLTKLVDELTPSSVARHIFRECVAKATEDMVLYVRGFDGATMTARGPAFVYQPLRTPEGWVYAAPSGQLEPRKLPTQEWTYDAIVCGVSDAGRARRQGGFLSLDRILEDATITHSPRPRHKQAEAQVREMLHPAEREAAVIFVKGRKA